MIGEELKARTRKFALDVIRLCLQLGDDDLARLVRPQLLRAGSGVASNYRATRRARSTREFISRLGVVIEEADEAELWLDVLETLKHSPVDQVISLRREAAELLAIFSASRRTAQQNARARRPSSQEPDRR